MDKITGKIKTDYLESLRKVKILTGLSDRQLEELLLTQKIVAYNQDDIIFEQDSLGTTIYIVLEGEVSLLIDPEKMTKEATIGSIGLRTIVKLDAGESFGELALFDKKPRSVAAVANKQNTVLLAISAEFFDGVIGNHRDSKNKNYLVLGNIINDISAKLRNTNQTIINEMLSVYFVKSLVEELQFSPYKCSYFNPLKRQVVIHVPEHFMLSKYLEDNQYRKKELIDIYFITEPRVLKRLLNDSYPSGEVIINTLLSVIRSGKIPSRVNQDTFSVRFYNIAEFKKGTLIIRKKIKGIDVKFFVNWELKGVIHSQTQHLTFANLSLAIYEENQLGLDKQVSSIIKTFSMPIQNKICSLLSKNTNNKKVHLIVIHHRTDEVVNTVEHLKRLGYLPDVLIGIPYGEVDWKTMITLDYCSNHTFQTLRTVIDPTQPIKYVFDFKASSFMSLEMEKALLKLFENPEINGSYLSAMEALIKYSLVKILNTCVEKR